MSADSVAQDQIRAFVDRILRLKEEAKSINGDVREVYAEAKANGFDKTALGKVVSYVEKRAAGAADLAEAEALFDLYLSAYDGASHTHAREDEPEHDAETGEVIEREVPVTVAAVGASPANLSAVAAQAANANEEDDDVASSPAHAPEQPGKDNGSVNPPAEGGANSATIHPLRHTYNPATHFENSKGLPRLHGCQRPDACGSEQARSRLCFSCSVQHDGPAHQDGAA